MAARTTRSISALLLAAAVPLSASHAADPGGAAVPDPVSISKLRCDAPSTACVRGARMVVEGEGLDGVSAVEFLGHRGTQDDRRARPGLRSPTRLAVIVPRAAHTGRLRLRTPAGDTVTTERPVEIVGAAPESDPTVGGASATSPGVFPIRGRHDLGQSTTNGFGGGRGHQGQDMFARCGMPLAAVVDATVQFAGWQSRAGNYLVLQDGGKTSYVYMHMRDPARVEKNERVVAGQRVGYVGQTGRADGCHLHFELWAAPGWYEGGEAVDPLPELRRWDADHKHD